MCIIVSKPAAQALPAKTVLETCWHSNPDGAGFMWAKDEQLFVEKGFMTFDTFWARLMEVGDEAAWTAHPLVMHFRIATAGGVNPQNTHPFWIRPNRTALVHNGILPTPPAAGLSDTATFVERLLRRMPAGFYQQEHFVHLIDEYIGTGNKLVLLDKEGKLTYWNKKAGTEEDGVWFSNTTFRAVRIRYTSPNYTGYSSALYDDRQYRTSTLRPYTLQDLVGHLQPDWPLVSEAITKGSAPLIALIRVKSTLPEVKEASNETLLARALDVLKFYVTKDTVSAGVAYPTFHGLKWGLSSTDVDEVYRLIMEAAYHGSALCVASASKYVAELATQTIPKRTKTGRQGAKKHGAVFKPSAGSRQPIPFALSAEANDARQGMLALYSRLGASATERLFAVGLYLDVIDYTDAFLLYPAARMLTLPSKTLETLESTVEVLTALVSRDDMINPEVQREFDELFTEVRDLKLDLKVPTDRAFAYDALTDTVFHTAGLTPNWSLKSTHHYQLWLEAAGAHNLPGFWYLAQDTIKQLATKEASKYSQYLSAMGSRVRNALTSSDVIRTLTESAGHSIPTAETRADDGNARDAAQIVAAGLPDYAALRTYWLSGPQIKEFVRVFEAWCFQRVAAFGRAGNGSDVITSTNAGLVNIAEARKLFGGLGYRAGIAALAKDMSVTKETRRVMESIMNPAALESCSLIKVSRVRTESAYWIFLSGAFANLRSRGYFDQTVSTRDFNPRQPGIVENRGARAVTSTVIDTEEEG